MGPKGSQNGAKIGAETDPEPRWSLQRAARRSKEGPQTLQGPSGTSILGRFRIDFEIILDIISRRFFRNAGTKNNHAAYIVQFIQRALILLRSDYIRNAPRTHEPATLVGRRGSRSDKNE